MSAEKGNSYFNELAINLRHEGFTVGPETDGLLPVELDGRHLCFATENGGIRYREEDIADDSRHAALDRATAVVRATSEYMSQMETAPPLTASGLEGDYRVLADFNGIVLAGHPTQYGHQFVTWERVQDRTALHQGDYYGPGAGADSYTAAKLGAGHFEESSIWDGNVGLAAHNRGSNSYFGQIHTLELGDTITLTTQLGTRTYEVTSVSKVSETDRSALAASQSNVITLYTCVRDERDFRWCVTGSEIV